MSSLPPSPTVTTPRKPLFQRAFEKYIQSLDGKTREKDFFAQSCDRDTPLSPDEINAMLQASVGERWLKHSTTRRVLLTLAAIQKEFDGVVNTLTSLDPTPISGVAWACVTALANFVDRYFKVSETIADALVALGDDLKRISAYDRLFGESLVLEDVLCQSYIDIFHFWSRVYQELHRPRAMKVVSAVVPLRSAKLDKIIANMRTNAERVEEQTKLVRRERAEQAKLVQSVRAFLGTPLPTRSMTAVADRFAVSQYSRIEEQCCDWIFRHSVYQAWTNGETPSPTLWVYAPPGSGKSVLCGRVTRIVAEDASATVASHYFRFDQNYTTLDVLKSLAAQLWEPCLLHHSSYELIETLARFAEDRTGDPTTRILGILHELVQRLPAVYFFLDGVDEEVAKAAEGCPNGEPKQNALGVLGVLDGFVTSSTGKYNHVRLWISSQNVAYTRKNFKTYTPFDIKDAVRSGIKCYLTRAIRSLAAIPQERMDIVLQQLLNRVESNFLWAHLIVIELNKATSPADMDEILEQGRVEDLDAYYNRFFDKFMNGNKASFARDVFSLVTFARRPLRVGEIQEALAILRSPIGHLEESRKPFLPNLLELFSPFIEVQEDGNSSADCGSDSKVPDTEDLPRTLSKTCRLFHSTLFDFLRRHADILCEEDEDDEGKKKVQPQFRVCPLRIAEACLRYLSQDRYSRLLSRRGDVWVDTDERPLTQHLFLTYCAKNWDKHLDLVGPDGEDLPFSSIATAADALTAVALRFKPQIEAFIASPNFQTCIQIQSIWIDGAFSPYRWRNIDDGRVWVRRTLPRWIVDDTYCMEYHLFWWDWQLFLSCVGCSDPSCPFRQCIGEVDRCWWGALGSDNFLSNMESRYRTFRFETPREDGEVAQRCDFLTATAAESFVRALRLTSVEGGQLSFTCETWTYDMDFTPKLDRSQVLRVRIDVCRATRYAVGDAQTCLAYSVCAPNGAPIASFSADGRSLRVGTQVYCLGQTGEFHVFSGIDAEDEEYFEDITEHDGVVAVTRRRLPRPDTTKPTGPPASEEATLCGDEDSDSEWASEDESDISDSSDLSSDQGYETSSSCSSEEDRERAETDSDSVSEYPSEDDEEDKETLEEEEDDQEEEVSDFEEPEDGPEQTAQNEQDDGDSVYADSDDGVDPSTFAFGQVRAYGDQNPPKRRGRNTQDPDTPQVQQAYIQVFSREERLFRFRRKTQECLIDSPPALHPSESLLAWPLSGREVLFADYEDNTYFIRELGDQSSIASNLAIKCHFAESGRHLHIAAFEGRPIEGEEKKHILQLTLLVHTYRLCSTKPTRSPPKKIHTSQVDIGGVDRTQFSHKLPCTLTWSATHLYVSWRGLTLHVHRIPLFRTEPVTAAALTADATGGADAECPREIVLLPSSAQSRDVFFFPAHDGRPVAQVVIGALADGEKVSAPGRLAVPVGCLLRPEEDLGGWAPSESVVRRKGVRGTGKLQVALEQFDPDVDCVLEPFLWQGY